MTSLGSGRLDEQIEDVLIGVGGYEIVEVESTRVFDQSLSYWLKVWRGLPEEFVMRTLDLARRGPRPIGKSEQTAPLVFHF